MVGAVHVEQRQGCQRVGYARRFGNVPQPAERPGQTLYGRVVGRLGSFTQRKQATARAVIRLETFRINHPVFPTDVCKVQHQPLHPALVRVGEHDRIPVVHGLQHYIQLCH